MPPAHGQLTALAELITQATKVVEAAYAKTEKPYVPSLEDTESHPLDDTIYSEELRRAVQTIEGACAQLVATVGKPSHTVVNKGMAVFETGCLNVVSTFKIPDVLQTKPEGMHISEIAEKTGLEPRKIGRVLRLLSTRHVFTEVSENVFANNRLSILYLSSNPLSSLNLHFTDEVAKSTILLSEVLADKEWGHSYSPCHTPFNRYSGYTDPLFVFFEGATPRGAELGARFGLGMMGWGQATEAEAVIDSFPWKDLPHGTSIVDVGGGVGNITLQLAKKYPTLQLKLQDLPERIVQAKNEVWPEKCPEAIAEQRIEFKALDFFAESPIPNCDIYYLKNIIHDWPEAESIKILQSVRKAMSPNSRVLVQEYILQGTNRVSQDKAKYEQAPEPLLPNYGLGRIRQYYLDIDMMAMLNSEERHLSSFIKLGEAAGLRFEKVWDLGEMGLVEYRLADGA
ncbi:S-adenosyl-L-methionine-dependent methyltransferase [Panaeolus papilionaceus]|nr:S-adenosyl-L-methionine-dependent methyltransferase [Panaeolus papilionaceus]